MLSILCMKKTGLAFVFVSILLTISFTLSANLTDLTIVSQNLNRFYDDKDNGQDEKILSTKKYRQRVSILLKKISDEFNFADVIAFQEIENRKILKNVSDQLRKKYAKSYRPVLIEGNGISGLDVGFLIKDKFRVTSVQALFSNQTFSGKVEKLFSRPPLLINLCMHECMTIINVHLRSMKGLQSSRLRKRVSLKRQQQAETLAKWINQFQRRFPDKQLAIIGDFNALSPSDPYVDVIGTIIGNPDQQRPKWRSADTIDTDLVNVSNRVKARYRYSYLYKKRKQLLDYLLVSKNLKSKIKTINYSRIDYKFSDHSALKARIHFN